MKRTILVLSLAITAMFTLAGLALAQQQIEFKLGFKTLADQVPDVVGQPLENEHWGANGDSLQQTSNGLMAWRKADNWTAFTNGSRTWINGPQGVQARANDERFPWEAGAGQQTFSDPFAYCTAVGTIDQPDSRYVGPKIPDANVDSFVTLYDEQADYVSQFGSWRCFRSQPLACLPGANLPCWKMNTSQTPNDGMAQYCQANPDSDFIPAVATGHDTVYSWRCTGTTPTIERQWVGVDPEGFGTNFWYAMLPGEYLQAPPEQKRVQTGDRFEVVLKSNPTTGYKWQITWPPYESVVKLVGSTYRAQPQNPNRPPIAGAGGEEVWTFEAVNPGNVAIGLSYSRPWESRQPAQRHTVAVTVEQ